MKRIVDQINVHGYQGRKGRRDQLFELARKDGKRLWNSEYGENNADGLEMAHNIHLDFQYLRPTAWAYWQPLDAGGWGLIATDFSSKTLGEVNPKYFALAQYSRHIRPGMKIIESGSSNTVAAHDPAGRRLALVIFNEGPARTMTFDLTRFNTSRSAAARWVTEPKAEARYEFRRDLKLEGGRLECTLPADSVQTVEVRNLGRIQR